MILLLLAAASLAVQLHIFRDTPDHPSDRCAAVRDLCPEESLDSLMAARDSALADLRARASGSGPWLAESDPEGSTVRNAAPSRLGGAEPGR
jgi:hypothetical protein